MATVIEMLEREWETLKGDRIAARRLADVCGRAGGARSLAEVEAYVRGASPEDADAVLLALVARAVDEDDLAARVLLQLLMPGTRALARRWWALGDHDERAAAAVAAVYHRIRHYPLARRPGRVAANVVMDAARELRRSVPDPAVVLTADPTGRDRAEPGATPHPAVELAGLVRDAVDTGVVRAADAELITRSRIGGQRLADLARVRGVPERTLFAHRQRAERALVAAAHEPA